MIELITGCDGVIKVTRTRHGRHASSSRILPAAESIPDPVTVPRILRQPLLRGSWCYQLRIAAVDCRPAASDPLSTLIWTESRTDNGDRGIVVGIRNDDLAQIPGNEEEDLAQRWLGSQCLSSRVEVLVAEGA